MGLKSRIANSYPVTILLLALLIVAAVPGYRFMTMVLGLTAGTGESFTDAGAIASWAVDGVAFTSGLTDSTGARVMGGTGNGAFSPTAFYTREQAVLTALRLSRCG